MVTIRKLLVLAATVTLPLVATAPSHAATSFQTWAQGRGVYVPSKERLTGFQDDLAFFGGLPPPEASPAYRWQRLKERYGQVGRPYRPGPYDPEGY